ncbi:hypothetical protein EYF80_062734 [Liparis tanakae]|uniref:Uncharacterized protein n=1 Tax=Liparis tanakae TaxID=230148 RepID=A0A4Z2EEG9_9TELE|nr:hypothetical protein EYF80_062734 [Liparis tanakae]
MPSVSFRLVHRRRGACTRTANRGRQPAALGPARPRASGSQTQTQSEDGDQDSTKYACRAAPVLLHQEQKAPLPRGDPGASPDVTRGGDGVRPQSDT